MLVSEIGLCCVGFFASFLSLGIRKMFAWQSSLGISYFSHIRCTNVCVIRHAIVPPYLSSSAVIPSGPGAFLFGRWSKMCFIAFL